MRPGQNKRSRGRNGGPHHGGGGGGGGGGGNRPRMPHRTQTFDSNGPSVKIRGNAYQVFERYVALAREAAASGDRISAENLYQHAEHYFRVMNANGDPYSHGQPRPMTPADTEMAADGDPRGGDDGQMHQVQVQHQPMAPAPSPVADDEFGRDLDESITADRRPESGRGESQLPPFITGRPD